MCIKAILRLKKFRFFILFSFFAHLTISNLLRTQSNWQRFQPVPNSYFLSFFFRDIVLYILAAFYLGLLTFIKLIDYTSNMNFTALSSDLVLDALLAGFARGHWVFPPEAGPDARTSGFQNSNQIRNRFQITANPVTTREQWT